MANNAPMCDVDFDIRSYHMAAGKFVRQLLYVYLARFLRIVFTNLPIVNSVKSVVSTLKRELCAE